MLERAAQRNQATLEAHLKEFSEEGPVQNANIFDHAAGLILDPLVIQHIPHRGVELVISLPISTMVSEVCSI